jgi:hypothetical protein
MTSCESRTACDESHVVLDAADDTPVRLTLAADDRAVQRLVVVEFERAERGATGGDEAAPSPRDGS